MQIIADLHLHSRFSRAVSPQMTITGIASWGVKKGIGLMATGDWTHPMWMREIGENLEEDGSGLLKLRKTLDAGNLKLDKEIRGLKLDKANLSSSIQRPASIKFLLSTEISCIYSQNGKTRRVHTLVWVPTIASAVKINQELTKRGCNLLSDGRPIIGLSVQNLAELVFTLEPNALVVPAHIWTPWFSVYGKMGGFESLEEAFGPYAKQIYAVETGLSSSPDMNWRIKELDTRSIVSFSDAHSGPKLGREATVFNLESLTYENIRIALMNPTLDAGNKKLDKEVRGLKLDKTNLPSSLQHQDLASSIGRPTSKNSIVFTIEFYPEEGKYHYTGHRECNIRLTPDDVVKKGTTCPVCGKPLTQGVMQRVEEIATRSNEELGITNYELEACKGIQANKQKNRPPFIMLVPLQEIISEAIGSPVASPKTQIHYDHLTSELKGEFNVLLHASLEEVAALSTPEIADGVKKVRSGDIVIDPGYDGVFGVVKIWKSEEERALVDKSKEQLGLF